MSWNWTWVDWAWVTLIVVLGLLVGGAASAAPCFDSLDAARAFYGPAPRLAWQGPKGHFEYFRGHRGQHVKCDDIDPQIGAHLREGGSAKRVSKKAGGPTRPSSAFARAYGLAEKGSLALEVPPPPAPDARWITIAGLLHDGATSFVARWDPLPDRTADLEYRLSNPW